MTLFLRSSRKFLWNVDIHIRNHFKWENRLTSVLTTHTDTWCSQVDWLMLVIDFITFYFPCSKHCNLLTDNWKYNKKFHLAAYFPVLIFSVPMRLIQLFYVISNSNKRDSSFFLYTRKCQMTSHMLWVDKHSQSNNKLSEYAMIMLSLSSCEIEYNKNNGYI